MPSIYERRHAPPPRRRAGRRWTLRFALVAALLSVVAAATAGLRQHYLPDAIVLPGLMIDGQRVPGGADLAAVRALVERRAEALAARPVTVRVSGDSKVSLNTTLGALGLVVDVDETVAAAARAGHWGDVSSRALAAQAAREGRVDVPLVTAVDPRVAFAALAPIKEARDTPPVSARLDLDHHTTIPGEDGAYVDVDAAVALLEAAARAGGPEPFDLALPVARFAPRITAAFLESLDISTVIAGYETYFSRAGDKSRRGANIDNAARKLDGLVLSPGEMVSFNEVVGERSEANGFQKSWEIFKGEMVEGIGGGTCQVASTLHAAAFFGGLDVLERLPHSRPSAYIPMGLDATVVYPGVDLKLRNPLAFPVVVHAKTERNKLRIELLGKARPVRVTFERELVETRPYKRKVVEDPRLTGTRVVRKQHGIRGFEMERTRTLVYQDGTRREEKTKDTYPPTTEIYEVPVGFDVSLLPPLPEEATDEDTGEAPAANAPPEGTAPPAEADGEIAAAAPPAIDVVEAKGAHAPTAAQANPAKRVRMRR